MDLDRRIDDDACKIIFSYTRYSAQEAIGDQVRFRLREDKGVARKGRKERKAFAMG